LFTLMALVRVLGPVVLVVGVVGVAILREWWPPLRLLFHELPRAASLAVRQRHIRRRARRAYGDVRVYPHGYGWRRRVEHPFQVLHDFVVLGPSKRTRAVFHSTDQDGFYRDLQRCIKLRSLTATQVRMIEGVIVLSFSGSLADWQNDTYELLYLRERQTTYWRTRLGEVWVKAEAADRERETLWQRAYDERRRRFQRQQSDGQARSDGSGAGSTGGTPPRNNRRHTWNGRCIERCFYAVLKVNPRARQAAIKRAYRALMQQYHPDHGGDPEIAMAVNVAYEVLGDPAARHQYNAENGYS
jgi:hypothetical protein